MTKENTSVILLDIKAGFSKGLCRIFKGFMERIFKGSTENLDGGKGALKLWL